MTQNRPLSPHLTIYKPQITSILSIMHRATGAFLYGGLILTIWALIFYVYQCDCIFTLLEIPAIKYTGLAILLAMTFSLFYHLFNGIRHLCWDMGVGFEMTAVRRSGWLVIIATVAATALSWWCGLHY